MYIITGPYTSSIGRIRHLRYKRFPIVKNFQSLGWAPHIQRTGIEHLHRREIAHNRLLNARLRRSPWL